MRTHRIGTMTLGAGLVAFGILFLIRSFWQGISYGVILRCWPLLFIGLGLETLWSLHDKDQKNWIYDKGAIFLMILLSCFAMAMACAQFMLEAGSVWGQFHGYW